MFVKIPRVLSIIILVYNCPTLSLNMNNNHIWSLFEFCLDSVPDYMDIGFMFLDSNAICKYYGVVFFMCKCSLFRGKSSILILCLAKIVPGNIFVWSWKKVPSDKLSSASYIFSSFRDVNKIFSTLWQCNSTYG